MVSKRTERIAKNTLILYVQLFLGMMMGLYTSRVILNELGVEDYGVYNVVGGVVGMFSLLNMSMSATTSRFITIELGNKNMTGLKPVFALSLTIHVLLGLLVVVIAEPIGWWFLQNELQIPSVRMEAAVWVFHCAVLATFIIILNVPYNAMIIAHERMHIYAYFSLIDVFLRLALALSLYGCTIDKLKYYAVALMGIQFLMQFIFWLYCFLNFKESRTGLGWEKEKFKEMSAFAGWSLFGDSAALMFTQGLNILLNIFFGPAINAARGIAVQVQNVLVRFTGSFQTALNPQLTKSYASGDHAYMHKLIYASSKFSVYIFLLLSLPVLFETKLILFWWLQTVPDHTISFLRIIVLISVVDCLTNPLIISAKASGDIRKYQIVLGVVLLSIVPISYVLLKIGFPPESVFFVHLLLVSIGHYVRILLVQPLINLDVKEYVQQVIVRVLLVMLIAPILPALFHFGMHEGILRFLSVSLFSVVSIGLTSWWVGINAGEKELIMQRLSAQSKK